MSIEVLRLIKVRANLEPAFREQLMKSPLKFLQEYDLTEDEKQQIILPHCKRYSVSVERGNMRESLHIRKENV